MQGKKKHISFGTGANALEELDAPVGEVGKTLLALWENARHNGKLPRRDEIPTAALARIMPNLYIIEALEGGQDFTARFFGSNLVELMGLDFTGMTLADLDESQRWRRQLFQMAMDRKRPFFYLFDLGAVDKPHYKTANTILPILDSEGQYMMLLCGSEVTNKSFDVAL